MPPSALAPGARRCTLKVYAYNWLKGPLASILHTAHLWNRFGLSAQRRSCLVDSCSHDTFDSKANVLAFTAEALLWKAMLERCEVVPSAADADVFLVPFWIGTTIVMGWGHEGFRTPELVAWLDRFRKPHELQAWLPHLANYSTRHIFLCTTDSQYVYLGPKGSSPGPEKDAIWVHYGDDHYTAHHAGVRRPGVRHGWPLAHGLTVPYRVSHWLPYGHPAPILTKRFLLYSAASPAKHSSRRMLHMLLRNQSAALGLTERVRLVDTLPTARTASAEALRATFCLCPTGDSKGFTARFYWSILHGCIPVRYDGWRRRLTRAETAYPYPSLIEWEKIVIDVDELLAKTGAPYEALDRVEAPVEGAATGGGVGGSVGGGGGGSVGGGGGGSVGGGVGGGGSDLLALLEGGEAGRQRIERAREASVAMTAAIDEQQKASSTRKPARPPPRGLPSLLWRLYAIPQSEVRARQEYMRHVAHWLVYDREAVARRAAAISADAAGGTRSAMSARGKRRGRPAALPSSAEREHAASVEGDAADAFFVELEARVKPAARAQN